MKTGILAALTVAGGLVAAGFAMGTDIEGKWSTDPRRKVEGGTGSKILKILGGNSPGQGPMGPRGPRGPIGPNDAPRGPRGPRGYPIDNPIVVTRPRGGIDATFGGTTTLNAELKLDGKKGTVSGSLKFSKPDSFMVQHLYPIRPEVCDEFQVEDGVVTGDTFTFKTYVKFRNVRVPTAWKGRVEPDLRIVVEPLEALPCSEQLTGGPGFGKDTAILTFHRAERGEGLQGKWWTRDPGAIGVIELKAGANGTVTGAYGNVCQEERRLAGTSSTTVFSMTTATGASGFGPASWKGTLVDKDTLRITAEPPPQCVIERPTPFVLLPLTDR